MTSASQDLRTEILVVGSGAGGALTAALLAARGKEVVLAEEGPMVPPGSMRPFSTEEMEAQYRNGGITPALGVPPVPYAEGRCVGGSTEINSGLYHRPPGEALERWAEGWDATGLDPGTLNPFCAANEEELGVSLLARPPSPLSNVLVRGAESLGWRVAEVPRLYRTVAGSDGEPVDEKQSMARTCIPRGTAAGMRILPLCRVERLVGEGSRIHAAEAVATENGTRTRIRIAAKHFFVCGGAVQTPALLRRSGIAQNAGRTFGLHPTIKCAGRFDEILGGHLAGVPVHQVKEFSPAISIGGSISSPPHLAALFGDNWPSHAGEFREWRRIGVYYAMARGTVSGSVRNVPFFKDSIAVRYAVGQGELRTLWEGLGRLGELLFAAGANTVYPSVAGVPPIRSIPEWRSFLRHPPSPKRISLMSIHLFGSCPMGENPRRCVVDSYGKVHGFENVRVNDASILPDGPGVNPEGTILALARRNVERFLSGEGKG